MMRVHGGSDLPWDFSTNANALGPCPVALAAAIGADRQRYPDSRYEALIERLAQWHGVHASRVLLGGSASELIARLHMAARLLMEDRSLVVAVPCPAYGDYAASAIACGHQVVEHGSSQMVDMQWLTMPSSPIGENFSAQLLVDQQLQDDCLHLIDAAYQPLLLEGQRLPESAIDAAWTVWSPNKALGLCGVRGAYAIAPLDVAQRSQTSPKSHRSRKWQGLANKLRELEPSWVLSAEASAMLSTWVTEPVQSWLADSLEQLRLLKAAQLNRLEECGIRYQISASNFFVVQLAAEPQLHAHRLKELLHHGVALRDTTSMGLPNCARMRVHTELAQMSFQSAWRRIK